MAEFNNFDFLYTTKTESGKLKRFDSFYGRIKKYMGLDDCCFESASTAFWALVHQFWIQLYTPHV
jgi:hypothetical protein